MKGIILAGGTGSRLSPLTRVTNKHLLPVGPEPMIFHPIKKMVEAKVEEILVVTGREHMGEMLSLLGSGSEFGCRFTFMVQDEAGGIAEALGLAKNFVHGDKMLVLLGDNIFEDRLSDVVREFERKERGAHLLLKEVNHPERFGVAQMDEGRVVQIVEKPKAEQKCGNMAVTGIYLYDAEVFDIIQTLQPSGRGELEITDVNNAYLRRGLVSFGLLRGWWTDAGTFETLYEACRLVRLQLATTGR
jgi:glucose-1-phosphate thymidylyltransferase